MRLRPALALLVLLAGCRAVPEPVPVAPPPPPPAPPAPAALPAAPVSQPWDVAPVSPGGWTYRQEGADSRALFGEDGAPPLVSIRCSTASRQIAFSLMLADGTARQITLHTSAGILQWQGLPGGEGSGALTVTRPAADPGFDWIASSRGRIGIALEGVTRLVLPSGGEIARVVEDCRS